ncbi:MAG: transcriptional coactivator p15/PC4 family protein [Pseudomonadota bacterium]
MRTDQIEGLKAQRGVLVERLQEMMDTPNEQRPQDQKALRAWLRDLKGTREALEQLDDLLRRLEARNKPKPTRQAPAPAESCGDDSGAVVARIPRGARAELRVEVRTWKGRRLVEIRRWAVQPSTGELQPTRKGVTMEGKDLPALIDALMLASQHAPSR